MNKKIIAIAIVDAMILTGTPAFAQEQTRQTQLELEEVVVTARRYEESAQAIPVAVTAMTGDMLARRGISGADDLQMNVPSLSQVPQGAQRSSTLYSMRGVGTEDALIPMDTAVGTYFAEAPQSRPVGFSKSFFDIANVQVLKGPQGTVFGRNTTGGAIVVEPNLPEANFDYNLNWTYKDHALGDGNQVTAMINLPITDTVAIRLAGTTEKMDGFFENVASGQKVNSEDYSAFRASVRFTPTDALESTFIYDYYDVDDDGTAFQAYPVGNAGLFAGTAALQKNLDDNQFQSEVGSGLPNTYGPATHKLATVATNKGIINKTSYQINDDLLIKNVISYREINSADWVDFDGQYAINPFDPVQVGFSGIAALSEVENEAFSEEIQLQGSSFDEAGTWVLGAFYFNEKGVEDSPTVSFGAPGSRTVGSGENTSYAIFGQLDYQTPIDGLSVTMGLRNTWDKRTYTVEGTTYGSDPAVAIPAYLAGSDPTCRQREYIDPANPSLGTQSRPLNDCAVTTEDDDSEYTYNLTATYQINDDKMVYIAHRRGYRSFAFNPRAELPGDFEAVPSEIVLDLELGLKADWDIGFPVRTNIAVFRSNFDDMQRQRVVITPSGTVGTVLFSAEKAHSEGVELEFTLLPTDWLEINGFYSYTTGEYDKFIAPPSPIAPNGTDLTDADGFMNAPEEKFGVTFRARLPMDEAMGDLHAQVGYSWQGTTVYDNESNLQLDPTGNSSDLPFGVQKSYGLVNASISWDRVMGSNFDLRLFGSNLTDEHYHTQGLSFGLGANGRFTAGPIGDPRVVGLSATYNYE